MKPLLDATPKPPRLPAVESSRAQASIPIQGKDAPFKELLMRADRPARPQPASPARESSDRPASRPVADRRNADETSQPDEQNRPVAESPVSSEGSDIAEASTTAPDDQGTSLKDQDEVTSEVFLSPEEEASGAGEGSSPDQEDQLVQLSITLTLEQIGQGQQDASADAAEATAASITTKAGTQGKAEALSFAAVGTPKADVTNQAAAPIDPQVMPSDPAAVSQAAATSSDDSGLSGDTDTNENTTGAAQPANARAGSATSSQLPAFETATQTVAAPNAADSNASERVERSAGKANALARFDRSGNAIQNESGNDTDAVNSARLSRGLRAAVNQQGGSVTLRLTPPEMGTVRIQLDLSAGNVTARFHAETDNARQLLQQQLGQLRQSLESHGLNVDRLSVQTMSSSNTGFSQQQQDSSTADGRSRGQFFNQNGSSQQQRDDADSRQRQATAFNQLFATAGADA